MEKHNIGDAKVDYGLRGLNGSPDTMERLLRFNFDPRALQPWLDEDGYSYITQGPVGNEHALKVNASTTLRKDEWLQLETAILKAAQQRLRAVADLRAAGLTYVIPNGLAKTVLAFEMQGDINDADISMDGLRFGQDDRPQYKIGYLPLPIIHKDFQINARQLAESRNGSTPLDTTMGEMAGRKVSEMAEKLVVGTASAFAYGGGTIYGYSNYTSRMTKTITSPAATAWTPATTVTEVAAMLQQSRDARHYGPWMVYFATGWSQYLDRDYTTNYPVTLRERLLKLDGVQDIRVLDFLSGYDVVVVEMSTEVVRLVIGMDVTVLEWESYGGLLKNYKVMSILIPQLRCDYNSRTGIVHGTTA